MPKCQQALDETAPELRVRLLLVDMLLALYASLYPFAPWRYRRGWSGRGCRSWL